MTLGSGLRDMDAWECGLGRWIGREEGSRSSVGLIVVPVFISVGRFRRCKAGGMSEIASDFLGTSLS
jgi:hypothetical protein